MSETTTSELSAAKSANKGKLVAFKNHKAAADNKRPSFEGEASLIEGDSRKLALWAKPGKDGAIVLTGNRASTPQSATFARYS